MKKRNLLWVIVLLLVVTACSGRNRDAADGGDDNAVADSAESITTETNTPSNSPATSERAVIRFAVNEFDVGNYADLVALFEEENPDVDIRVVSINQILDIDTFGPADLPDDAALQVAQSADVFSINSVAGYDAAVVQDIGPFLDSDSTLEATDFYPNALQREADGRLLVLPTELAFNLIYYDRDAFEAAGVPLPAPGWTWDDFRAAAVQLTERRGNEVTRWGYVAPTPDVTLVLSRLTTPLVNVNTDPATPRYEDADVADAVAWYTDLLLVDEAAPIIARPDDDGAFFVSPAFDLIESGQAAMWTDFSNAFNFRQQQGNIGTAPLPQGGGNAATTPLLVDSGFVMSAGTVNPAAAWRWLSFLSGQEQPGFGGGASLPARQSVAETSGFWDDLNAQLADTLRYAVDNSYAFNFGAGYEPLADALDAIVTDGEPVAVALAQAQVSAESDIAEADAEQTTVESFTVINDDRVAVPGAETIVFVVAGGAFDLGQYRDLADSFSAQNPQIAVEVQAPNFTGDTISLSSLISGGDCFQTGGALDDPDFLSAILPLDPFADADAAFDRQDFFPALLSQFTKDGQLWGLPAELNPTVLEYNRELFDAAGVPYPTQAWTLDQFVDAAIALTDGDGEFKTYGFVPDAFELTTMLVMIERYGANLIDDSIDPPTLAFTSDRTIEALRWYVNLAKELGVKPAFVTDPSQLGNDPTSFIEREGIIDEGRAGMWTTFGPTAGATGFGLGNRAAMDIGVAPLPLGPGGGAGFDQASGYFIAADTTQRRACWDWLTFLTESADAVQGLPGRISVAESAAYRQKVGAERADAYIASIADTSEGGIFRFFGTSQGGWLGPSIFWLGRAHSQAVDEVFTVEEALSEAQAKFDEYRSCIIANDAIDDADGQNDCLEEVDPTLGAFFGG